jgi:hypothetical protein
MKWSEPDCNPCALGIAWDPLDCGCRLCIGTNANRLRPRATGVQRWSVKRDEEKLASPFVGYMYGNFVADPPQASKSKRSSGPCLYM